MKMTIYKSAILFTLFMGLLNTSCANSNYKIKENGESIGVENEQVDESEHEDEEKNCQICFGSMEDSEEFWPLPCSSVPHQYHKSCLAGWVTYPSSLQNLSMTNCVKRLNRVAHMDNKDFEKLKDKNHFSCPMCRSKITNFQFLLDNKQHHWHIIQTVKKLKLLNPASNMQRINLEKEIKEQVQQCALTKLIQDKEGNTLLHWIIEVNSKNLLKFFWGNAGTLSRKIYFDRKNKAGQTPLHIAVLKRKQEMVKLLLDSGADMNQQDKAGQTSLHIAVLKREQEMVKLLLDSGADMNQQDKEGQTPLYIAVQNEDQEMVKLLLDSGADMNQQDEEGVTPLYIAVLSREKDMVNLLLKGGADMNQQDKAGQTPLNIAEALGIDHIVNCLLKHCNRTPGQL